MIGGQRKPGPPGQRKYFKTKYKIKKNTNVKISLGEHFKTKEQISEKNSHKFESGMFKTMLHFEVRNSSEAKLRLVWKHAQINIEVTSCKILERNMFGNYMTRICFPLLASSSKRIEFTN